MRRNPEIQNRLDSDIRAVRKILKECWDPIPGTPEDEYDDIVIQLVSAAHKLTLEDKAGESRIYFDVIMGFQDHYGFSFDEQKTIAVSKLIFQYFYDRWRLREELKAEIEKRLPDAGDQQYIK